MHPPFPNLPFAIAFAGILMAGLAYAAYVDWFTLTVPKKISVGLFAVGMLMSTIRGAWLGADGHPTWILSGENAFIGGLDGLLFGLVGFIAGFGLFFVLWIFGIGYGGDVKLVGATGAWIGWQPVFVAVGISLPFLVAVTVLVSAGRLLSGSMLATSVQGGKRTRRVTTYSLPFALGVGVVIAILMVEYVKAAP